MDNNDVVTRAEFNNLENRVKNIEIEEKENRKLLQMIDKKIDIIDSKIVTADKIEDLKLTPLEKRVDKLEDSQLWLRRTVVGSVLAIVFEAIVFVIKMMN